MIKPNLYIGGEKNPYMLRWHLLPKVGNLPRLYLHKFLRSDDDRALHDHPWWFVSVMLKGSYVELREDGPHRRTAPSIAFRPINTRHRVVLERVFPEPTDPDHWSHRAWEQAEKPVWTIILTGPDVRGWGFWCKETFVPWREFDGCGEDG